MEKTTLNQLISSGIVAVVRKVDPEKVNQAIHSVIAGGVSCIEITMDSEKPLETINALKDLYGEKALIGAGTVVNKNQAEAAINAGADFIFAPIIDRETIEFTKEKEKIMVPGAFTPSEIYQAYQWGADIIKVFPANVLGPGFFNDVKGPLSEIPLMPTGGISLDNLQDYMEVGCVAVGVGSSLLKPELIQDNKWEELESLASVFVEKTKQVCL